ncbi:MAG: putative DNA binding domain-containing protein [Candidatus Omnitrophica bacterium]|nr:putative DNA binding domain-containing protein [Candidatus Omnitrophota bacterium]
MEELEDNDVIPSLIEREESQIFECKQIQKKPSDVLPTLCAFANSDGGIFIYGLIDPAKAKGKERLAGISGVPDHSDELLRLIGKDFDPPLRDVTHFFLKIQNVSGNEDKLLLISIEPSKEVHSLRSGYTYLRQGKQNVHLTHRQSLQLQYEKGSISYESEEVKRATLNDLDASLIGTFLEFNKSAEIAEPLKFFSKNGLAVLKNGEYSLTNAAVLLFGNNPTVALHCKSGITIVHYYGIRRVPSEKPNFVRPPFTIEGPLIFQIKKAFQYVLENSAPIRLKGATFRRLKIPEYAFQEAITNAVIHRDYSIQNHIQIRLFDNRVEVESPGWFPGLVAPETILEDRFARNPIIERILKKMPEPPNLDIGEGVNRMFHEMDKKNLYLPLFYPRQYSPHAVRVVLYNEERISYWDSVQKYLEEKKKITNGEFRNITGLGTLEASEFLKKWVSQNLLEKKGKSKKGTYYQKPGFQLKEANVLERLL